MVLIIPKQAGIGSIKDPNLPFPHDTIGIPREEADDIYQMLIAVRANVNINFSFFCLDDSDRS